MATNAGIWIDHEQAIMVLMTDAAPKIKKFASGIAKPGGAHASNTYAPRDHVAEDRLERKVESQLKTYFDDIIAGLEGSETLLILGPGEAKGEFKKRIENKNSGSLTVDLETTDKLTEGQIQAKVIEHFGKVHPVK